MNEKIDWHTIVFNEIWLKNLEKLTIRRFGEGGLAEEAYSYVLESLSNDNWGILQSFEGQANPETFLHRVSLNFIEEFSRKRFGRPRPPEWLKRQGEFWITTWKLICLERQEAQTVIERMSDIRDTLFINHVIRTIKARIPKCGQHVKEISTNSLTLLNGDKLPPEDMVLDNTTPDQIISDSRHTELLLIINYLLSDSETLEVTFDWAEDKCNSTFSEKFNVFGENLKLTSEEKLILKMVYQDGINKTLVAKSLGMQSYQPGRILKRTFIKIRSAMVDSGFTLDDIIFESA